MTDTPTTPLAGRVTVESDTAGGMAAQDRAFRSLWRSALDLSRQLGYGADAVRPLGGNQLEVPGDVAELLEQRPPEPEPRPRKRARARQQQQEPAAEAAPTLTPDTTEPADPAAESKE